ncbi:LuxR family two component transcriptional regulator [Fluviicoccus keumensis]|uniref:LuxR family two component transcriptional regulator n=1 Tax=Fluviicoccus keumensis TaxID=1435465 RepID=A0A4Q7Z4L3_9GAMM|nr:response regulator transcription factor [Fluviicoccus keumensis]RZU45208.1 LuxR family two component transcriptional regulator [Fluviicoccus keumensis]
MHLLIIDDHPMTCAGLRSLLQACYPEAVIHTRHSAEGITEPAADADYIFLDMHLPDLGFNAMLDILSPWISRVILISAAPEPAAVAHARYRGVRGLLLKNADVEHVLDGFRRIQKGEYVFDPDMSGSDWQMPSLTDRQRSVFDALLEGLSNKQIARVLGISEHTVKEHVTAILGIFGVKNRLELVLSQQIRN